ncbi:hypothetical protein [Paraburkholderia youngii]|uniref:hypothetical protein n=1 Tax=Paraburkholderia youngii TaxID=2782701 RepID=UPI003D1E8F8A
MPQGGRFVGGSGDIAQNGTNLNITHSGSRGIIEWDNFSIGPHTATLIINAGSVDARAVQIGARNADGSGGAIDISGKEVTVGGADVQAKTGNITAGKFLARCVHGSSAAFDQAVFRPHALCCVAYEIKVSSRHRLFPRSGGRCKICVKACVDRDHSCQLTVRLDRPDLLAHRSRHPDPFSGEAK